MTNIKGSSSSADTSTIALQKEWDQALCPICMDHPHNAVLLVCSSYDKGCRSYICDTSHRHSNCLDRFKKPKTNNRDSSSSHSRSSLVENFSNGSRSSLVENFSNGSLDQSTRLSFTSGSISWSPNLRRNLAETHEDNSVQGNNEEAGVSVEARGDRRAQPGELVDAFESNYLKCPLCRGTVLNWVIVKEARQYLDQKLRACSLESCTFMGNYRELREHARRAHRTTRPADVDPSRRRAWRHLEHQREYGDVLSAIRSAMPGAVVLGDYAIDNGDILPHDHESSGSREGSRPWWATLVLFNMMDNPIRSSDEPRGLSGSWRRRGRTRHRYLWGENPLGQEYGDGDGSNRDDEAPVPRRRRRNVRSRSEERP